MVMHSHDSEGSALFGGRNGKELPNCFELFAIDARSISAILGEFGVPIWFGSVYQHGISWITRGNACYRKYLSSAGIPSSIGVKFPRQILQRPRLHRRRRPA
jgi:hypothetical protein